MFIARGEKSCAMQIIQMDSMVPNNEFLIQVSSLFLFIIYLS